MLAILLGTLTVTSYRPVPSQTRPECRDRWHCDTANGDGVTRYGIAVSQDLLRAGLVRYGDVLCVDGLSCRVVNDCMNPRIRRAVDLMVFTRAEEKRIGVRHLKVYKLEVRK